jgi:hypothetical protein
LEALTKERFSPWLSGGIRSVERGCGHAVKHFRRVEASSGTAGNSFLRRSPAQEFSYTPLLRTKSGVRHASGSHRLRRAPFRTDPRKGCKFIVTAVTCVIPLKEQQLTTTSIVTPIVIAGTTIVTAGIGRAEGGDSVVMFHLRTVGRHCLAYRGSDFVQGAIQVTNDGLDQKELLSVSAARGSLACRLERAPMPMLRTIVLPHR